MSVRHPSRRRSVIALVLLAIIVTAMAVVIRTSGTGQPLVDPTVPPVPPLPTYPTLLVQVRDDGLTSVNNVVMGLDSAANSGSSLYLPQNLVVDLVEGRDETLGLTGFQPIARAGSLVSAQTGMRVDHTFVMDRLAFAGLIDSVGGISLDIAEPLVVQARWGSIVEIIPMGLRTLDGPQAAIYSLYLPPGAPESERQARFAAVWQAILEQLPSNPDQMRAVLASLGALSRSTDTLAALAEFLTAAGTDSSAGRWTSANLPTTPGAYGPLPVQWVEPVAATETTRRLFPEAMLSDDAPPVRVRVHQSGGTQAQLDVVRTQLTDAGFTFVWSGPAEPLPVAVVAVADRTQTRFGMEVVTAIDAGVGAVVVNPGATPGSPVTLRYVPPAETPADATGVATPGPTVTSFQR